MATRCNPRIVTEAYHQAGSWRKATRALNELYNVSLSHTTWHDYAIGKNDIADKETRARLGLSPLPCPSCGRKHSARKITPRAKRIRAYGYPPEPVKSFIEVLNLREAMR